MSEPKPPEHPNDFRPSRPEGPLPPVKFSRSLLGWVLFGGLLLLLTMVVYKNVDGHQELSYTSFLTHLKNKEITELTVKPGEVIGVLSESARNHQGYSSTKFVTEIRPEWTAEQWFQDALETSGAQVTVDAGDAWWSFLPQLLMWVLLLLVIYFFFFRQLRAAGSSGGILGNFGRSRHRVSTKERTNVTFNDVAGIEEAKEEVREIIEFLRNPRRFQRLGARIPRGVLLVGEPGCGKTLLAKAIAGEAEVPFFSISGSDFVEMFVGVGASRVRDLFKSAKENAPCIIFLDEIDAVGRRRGANFSGGGHDEREQTLNAILVEMDGFDTSDQVIVIAATNRMDVLDPALTRPGRFDRQIDVPLPDIKGRVEILKIYANKIQVGPDVDLHRLARGTPMFSGADLAALINEAAIAATLANKEFVDQADLEEARDKVRWGRARKSRVIDEREKEMTAYHEAGHALVQVLSPDADPLHKVSIIPRGTMGGATFSLPEKDRHMYTRRWCEAFLRVSMAGRIAEEMFCGDIDSGAASDIAHATDLARRMVMDWGMSTQLGFVRYAPMPSTLGVEFGAKEYSEKTAEIIDQEIEAIMAAAEKDARSILDANRQNVQELAKALLKYETLDAEEVQQLLEGKPLNRPSVLDLIEAEHAKGRPEGAGEPAPQAGPDLGGALPQPG